MEEISNKKEITNNERFNNETSTTTKLIFKILKYGTDIVFSLIGLIIGIPLIITVTILIKLETRGPAIYTQTRVGKDGSLFKIYKFRSMYFDAERGGVKWAQRNDSRITKVGKFIRKTRIDEIPQLLNVLRGDMSIVGPRPERPYFIDAFSQELPKFKERLAVRPGITGWAQIHGGYELSPEQKLEKDLFYIENQSTFLDMMIILKTVKIVITFEGAR